MITRDMLERYCAQAGLNIDPSELYPKAFYENTDEISIDKWVIARTRGKRIVSIQVWFGDEWKDVSPQDTQELGKILHQAIDDLLERCPTNRISPILIAVTKELLIQAGSEIVGI